MVTAELRDVPYVAASQAFVVRNYGPTIARNVKVTFDPEIPDPDPDKVDQSAIPYLKRRYANPIPVFTPGMELDNIWYSGRPAADGGGWTNALPIPDQVTVDIEYEAPDGTRYMDQFLLDTHIISPDSSRELLSRARRV